MSLLVGLFIGAVVGYAAAAALAYAKRGDRLLGIPGEGERDRRPSRW